MGSDSNDKLEEFRKGMPANFRDRFDRDSPLVQEYICEWLTETQGRAVFYAQYQFVKKEAKKSIIKRGWGSGTELQELLIPPLEQMLPNYRWSKEYKFRKGRQQAVDLAGRPNPGPGPEIWIESERDRHTCVRNVVKVWQDLNLLGIAKYDLLIQIFSPLYGFGEENQHFFLESEFVGKKAEKDAANTLRYESHVSEEWPLLYPNRVDALAQQITSIATGCGF